MRKTNKTTKTKYISFAVVTAVILSSFFFVNNFHNTEAVTIDELGSQISALENQIKNFERRANELAQQSASLANEIAKLQAEENALQEMINLSQLKHDQLVQEIAINEQKIQDNQDALGYVIADAYIEGQTTLLERIASSKNLSEFIDNEAKSNSVSGALTKTVKEIKTLRDQLEKQRAEVKALLEEQQAQKKILAEKSQERQNLLAQTRGEEAEYQRLKSGADAQRLHLLAEQQRMIDEATNGGKNVSGAVGTFKFRNHSGGLGCVNYPSKATGIYGGNYGCNYALDQGVDQWALYNRECVSYAAYAAYYRFGKHVTSFRGLGDAHQWPDSAPALMGARTDNTPEVGATAIRQRGSDGSFPFGHAMIVEQILSDGWIKVSQFNFVRAQYSTMEIPSNSVVYVHFKNR